MNVYLIERPEGGGYDEAAGFVVVAPTERDAKWDYIIRDKLYGLEGPEVWAYADVTVLGFASWAIKPGVVLRDFND